MRLRQKVKGTASRPRLAVSFTANNMYVQFIDDETGHTLASMSTLSAAFKALNLKRNVAAAQGLGKLAAEKAKEAGILPDWYIPICDETNEMSPRIRRIMCGTFLSGEMERDEKMLYAANNYNQFLDGESRKSLCSFFGYKA